VGHPVYMIINM